MERYIARQASRIRSFRSRFAWLGNFRRDESGQDLIEYALMASFLAIACAGFVPWSWLPPFNALWAKIVGAINTALAFS